ncbi:uncharacterized protein LOC135691319 [Rhopilema esculentum]|uniref:uncharacterized protein LOC135691319 n=1 Tax=Rhopilema esculentum TaxID=499914 RepID=UPI0031E45F1A
MYVPDQPRVYDSIKGPPGFTCTNKTKIDHSLADPGGWKSVYNGYQTSVDVYFTCQNLQDVANLVQKIKYEISLNKLHERVGFHVIGWVLYRWYCSTMSTTPMLSTHLPTTEPIPTTEPSPMTITTADPGTGTTPKLVYCPHTNSLNHRLTVSFVFCIDYIFLLQYEKTNILSRVSNFMNVTQSRLSIYRLQVPDQPRVYDFIRTPPGFTCTNKTKLDHSLADPGGWRSVYNGYQTSVDVYFTCQDAQSVADLVTKIKYEISLNKLHDRLGFHVIGWVLYHWDCVAMTTTPKVDTTTERTTTAVPLTTTNKPATEEPTTTAPITNVQTTTSEPTTQKPTTEQPTTMATTTPRVCQSPVQNLPSPVVSFTAGNVIAFVIPATLFLDAEDGNTIQLQLQLTKSSTNFPSKCWFAFNQTTQSISGLTYTNMVPSGQNTISFVFTVTATDSCQLSTSADVSFNIQVPGRSCFTMLFVFQTRITRNCEFVPAQQFAEKVAAFYGLRLNRDITVIDFSKVAGSNTQFQVLIGFSSNVVGCQPCNFTALTELKNRIIETSTGSVKPEFVNVVSPEFIVNSVAATGLDSCATQTTTSLPSTTLTPTTTPLTTVATTPRVCQSPVQNIPNPVVSFTAGNVIAFVIPAMLFLDAEDGNTRQLQLQLTKSSTNFPSKCWFAFNRTTQSISGLTYTNMLPSGQNSISFVFTVTATDSCQLSTSADVSFNIQVPGRSCFTMFFVFQTRITRNCEFVPAQQFAEKVAAFYGLRLNRDITVIDFSKVAGSNTQFQVLIGFSSNIVGCQPCNFTALTELKNQIIESSTGSVKPEFINVVSPEFIVNSVAATGLDSCATQTTTSLPSTTLPPTTTPLTTVATTPRVCQSPVQNIPNPVVSFTAGNVIAFVIPATLFLDAEDGNTRQLQLQLTKSSTNFPSKCWFAFNQTTQSISGLTYTNMLPSGQNTISFVFTVTATDSCQLSTSADVSFNIQVPGRSCFTMLFVFQTRINRNCEFLPAQQFAEKVAAFYGLRLNQDITVIDFSKVAGSNTQFQVLIGFSSNVVSCQPCNFTALTELKNRIIATSTGSVKPEFVNVVSPEFIVNSVAATGLDSCATQTTTSLPSTTLPPTTTPLTTVSTTPRVCQSPVQNIPNPVVSFTAGNVIAFVIPAMLFLDAEDGNTRQLQLQLTKSSINFPSKCWFAFNQTTQSISGLTYTNMLPSGQNTISFVFTVTATDSCQLSTSADVSFNIQVPGRSCFTMLFVFQTRITRNCEFVPAQQFAEKVAGFYGLRLNQDITVIDFSKVAGSNTQFQVLIGFSSNVVSCQPCNFTALTELKNRIIETSTGSVKPEFINVVSPEFIVNSVAATGLDSCATQTTTSLPSTTLPPTTTPLTTVSTTPRVCRSPVQNIPSPVVSFTAGNVIAFVIPATLFLDAEDGNTRQLQLQLTKSSTNFPSKCWFAFNRTTQSISGLTYTNMLPSGQNTISFVFTVTATDSCQLSTSADVSFNIQVPGRSCFTMLFVFQTRITRNCEFVPAQQFAEKVAGFYGLRLNQDITVIDFSKVAGSNTQFQVLIGFSSNVVSCQPCNFTALTELKNRIIETSTGSVKPEFINVVSSEFIVNSVAATGLDSCATQTTTSLPSTTLRPTTMASTTDGTKICLPPRLVEKTTPLRIDTGTAFSYTIPEGTFFDKEDGNTRSLSLKLQPLTSGLPAKCWYSFDEAKQTFSGLSYDGLLNEIKSRNVQFSLLATDSCALTSSDNFTMQLSRPSRHCFEVSFEFKTLNLHECEWIPVSQFIDRVSSYLGTNSSLDIRARNFSKIGTSKTMFQVRIAILPTKVACRPCDYMAISDLTDRLVDKSDKSLKAEFKNFMSPSYNVIKAKASGTNACAPVVTPTAIVSSTGRISCKKPILVRPIKPLRIFAGKNLTFTIPSETFYDREDGNTRFLSVSVGLRYPDISPYCWFSYNATAQKLIGLPYSGLLGGKETITIVYNMTAIDSCGLSVADNFSLVLKKPPRHCFEMTFTFRASKNYSCEWEAILEFVGRVAVFYGFDMYSDMSVVSYTRSKKYSNRYLAKVSFSQKIIKCDQCNSTLISNLTYRVLHQKNYTVHYAFNSFLAPSFIVANVFIAGVDSCAAYVLPLTLAKKEGLPIWAWLLPVLIFSIALALILLLALCRCLGCCTCCVCLFPVEEDEEYFMRRECPPRRHKTYREFIGSDFDQNYPSMRKNRAGQSPDDTSIESADDLVSAGSDDNNLIPPYPGKINKPANFGGGAKATGASVTTIVYATPPIGKESTELSVFSNAAAGGGPTGDGVNVVYHNVTETSFGNDDDNYKRTHGSFESLILRHTNSTGNLSGGKVNGGFTGSATSDLDRVGAGSSIEQVGSSAAVTGCWNDGFEPPAPLLDEEKHETNIGGLGVKNGTTGVQLSIVNPAGGISNSGYDPDEVDIEAGTTGHFDSSSSAAVTFRNMQGQSSLQQNSRLSFDGNIGVNGQRNSYHASSCSGLKKPAHSAQSNVSGKAILESSVANEYASSGSVNDRGNVVNVMTHMSIPRLNSAGLLSDSDTDSGQRHFDGNQNGSAVGTSDSYTTTTNMCLHQALQPVQNEANACHVKLRSGIEGKDSDEKSTRGLDQSLHDQSLHDQSLHGQSLHGQSLHGQILHDQSLHGQSLHDQSLHDQSLHDQSLHGQSLHGQSLHDQSLHDQSLHGQSLHGQSLHDQSLHGQRLHDQSLHGQSLHDQSLHDQSLHGQSLHDQSLHGQSLHGQSLHGQSLHGFLSQNDFDSSVTKNVDADKALCTVCSSHSPCNENTDIICLVGHSKTCPTAGNVSCSKMERTDEIATNQPCGKQSSDSLLHFPMGSSSSGGEPKSCEQCQDAAWRSTLPNIAERQAGRCTVSLKGSAQQNLEDEDYLARDTCSGDCPHRALNRISEEGDTHLSFANTLKNGFATGYTSERENPHTASNQVDVGACPYSSNSVANSNGHSTRDTCGAQCPHKSSNNINGTCKHLSISNAAANGFSTGDTFGGKCPHTVSNQVCDGTCTHLSDVSLSANKEDATTNPCRYTFEKEIHVGPKDMAINAAEVSLNFLEIAGSRQNPASSDDLKETEPMSNSAHRPGSDGVRSHTSIHSQVLSRPFFSDHNGVICKEDETTQGFNEGRMPSANTSKSDHSFHSTSMAFMKSGGYERSEMMLGISGKPEALAGGVTSYHGEYGNMPYDGRNYITADFHFPRGGARCDEPHDVKWTPAIESVTPLGKESEGDPAFAKHSYRSQLEFDGTYRGEALSQGIALDQRRDSLPAFSEGQILQDDFGRAEIRRQKSLRRNIAEGEKFEFVSCDSDYDAIRRASLRRASWQRGHEGGIGIGDFDEGSVSDAVRWQQSYDQAEEGGIGKGRNYGVKRAGLKRGNWDTGEEGGFASGRNHGVKKAGILKTNYDKGEEGGFAIGVNYGTKKAENLKNNWGEGTLVGIGEGWGVSDELESAKLQRCSWGRGRRRYLSDSCILDNNDDDEENGFISRDFAATYGSEENLQLPATPFDERFNENSYRDRSYSLPDELDDMDDESWRFEEPRSDRPKRLIESVRFVRRPLKRSLKRNGSMQRSGGKYTRRHPDEANLIMRRGWFDVRRSIRVKVPVSMRARVKDDAVLTGPVHLDSFKVNAIQMPDSSYTTPDSITLTKTPDTKILIKGEAHRHSANDTSYSFQTNELENKSKFGTYEVKIPLK